MMRGRSNLSEGKRQAPSLVDLCVDVAIQNVKYLGDVGQTDLHLLDRFLSHCTLDQLIHIEDSTTDRDLTPVTDKLWKRFFEKQFGEKSLNVVVERMKQKKVRFRWRQLYEAKLKEVAEAEERAIDRFKETYKELAQKKQSRQIIRCTKVPPSSHKRSYFGGSGPGYNQVNAKSSIMKKAKLDYLNSQEMKNIAAMKKRSALQRTNRPNICGTSGTSNSASSGKNAKSLQGGVEARRTVLAQSQRMQHVMQFRFDNLQKK